MCIHVEDKFPYQVDPHKQWHFNNENNLFGPMTKCSSLRDGLTIEVCSRTQYWGGRGVNVELKIKVATYKLQSCSLHPKEMFTTPVQIVLYARITA